MEREADEKPSTSRSPFCPRRPIEQLTIHSQLTPLRSAAALPQAARPGSLPRGERDPGAEKIAMAADRQDLEPLEFLQGRPQQPHRARRHLRGGIGVEMMSGRQNRESVMQPNRSALSVLAALEMETLSRRPGPSVSGLASRSASICREVISSASELRTEPTCWNSARPPAVRWATGHGMQGVVELDDEIDLRREHGREIPQIPDPSHLLQVLTRGAIELRLKSLRPLFAETRLEIPQLYR